MQILSVACTAYREGDEDLIGGMMKTPEPMAKLKGLESAVVFAMVLHDVWPEIGVGWRDMCTGRGPIV